MYGEDGSSLIAEYGVVLAGGHSYYLVYDKGSTVPTKAWDSIMGRTTVTMIDPVTERVYLRQVWKERPDPTVPGGKRYLLMHAMEFNDSQQAVLRVEMSNNGSRPIQVIVPGTTGDTIKDLDDSGRKVIKIEGAEATASPSHSKEALGEEFVEINPQLLKMPDRPEVVSFNDLGPPRLYDYR